MNTSKTIAVAAAIAVTIVGIAWAIAFGTAAVQHSHEVNFQACLKAGYTALECKFGTP